LTRLRSQAAKSDIAAGERKAVSKGGLLLQRAAGAHQSIDPQLAKAGGGEQRAHATQLQMPSPGRVYRPGDELTNGSLGTISIFSPAYRDSSLLQPITSLQITDRFPPATQYF